MYAAGDLIQQRLEGRKRKKAVDRLATDWKRSGRMGSVGAPIGVLSHYWYTMLDRVLPGITRRAVVRKVMADQCIFGPICLSTFFVGMGVLEGKTSTEIGMDMKTLFPPAYLLEWAIWPAAQALNFYLVPPQMRVLYVSSVLLVWTVILSWIKHKGITST
jgi:protein Mpv17